MWLRTLQTKTGVNSDSLSKRIIASSSGDEMSLNSLIWKHNVKISLVTVSLMSVNSFTS